MWLTVPLSNKTEFGSCRTPHPWKWVVWKITCIFWGPAYFQRMFFFWAGAYFAVWWATRSRSQQGTNKNTKLGILWYHCIIYVDKIFYKAWGWYRWWRLVVCSIISFRCMEPHTIRWSWNLESQQVLIYHNPSNSVMLFFPSKFAKRITYKTCENCIMS